MLKLPINVVLAEDYGLVRAGLEVLIGGFAGIVVVAAVADGRAAIDAVRDHNPDVLLLDFTMPGLGGIETLSRVRIEHPSTHVLMISMHDNEHYVLTALQAGASGYVLKGADPTELEFAIRAVARGGSFLSPSISRRVIGGLVHGGDIGGGPGRLTPRQREIVQQVAEGHTNAEIASQLGLSLKTIETHRADVMKRLDIHDVAGLVRYAIRAGLVTSDV